MASQRTFSLGPVALTNTLSTNIFNCAITSLSGPVGVTLTQPYAIMKQVRIVNKTAGAVTFTLYKGLTGANTAGTEFLGTAISVGANSYVEYYPNTRFSSADFLVGGASANTSLTLHAEFEVGFS